MKDRRHEFGGVKDRQPESGGAKDWRPKAHGPESEMGPCQTEQSYGRVNQLRVAARKA